MLLLALGAVESGSPRVGRERGTMVHDRVLILGLIPVMLMLMAVRGGGEVKGWNRGLV